MRRFTQMMRNARNEKHGQESEQQSSPTTAPPEPPRPNHAARQQPAPQPSVSVHTVPGGPTLNIALQNQTTSPAVYAYITGRALDNNNALFLLLADGHTPYFPQSPEAIGAGIPENTAIALGAPGNTVTVTIPHLAGGRIYFSIDSPLTFFLNPGPALVEPSVTNPSDPNININWGFAEFTFNQDQLYANISYVDFVGPPVALDLTTFGGQSQHISGMHVDGLDRVCEGLRAQHAQDGKGWDKLIVTHNGRNLRALSPNQGMVLHPDLFVNYFEDYIDESWKKFSSQSHTIDTQASFGKVACKASGSKISFGGSQFSKPSTRDIFSCSHGPFQTGGNVETNTIIPRLAAAFNRSTVLASDTFPADRSLYYQHPVTNHYSRIVHEANLDGKGYAFPYDDVQPSGGPDQSGEVHAGDPKLFTVTVGGRNAWC